MNIQVGIGVSTDKDRLKAVQEAVLLAKTNLHMPKVDLAIVFSTVDFATVGVTRALARAIAPAEVVGASSFAIISDKGILRWGIAVCLLSFPKDVRFNIACVKDISAKTPFGAGNELGEKLLYSFQNIRRALSVTFSDGLIGDASGFLWGLQERLGRSFPLAGALASDNLAFKRTYAYFGAEALTNSACGLLLGGKINFGLGIKHGWKPLGKMRRVTKAKGNVIYEIDDEPAAKIYEDYFGKESAELKKDLKRISVLYPIGIYLAGEEEYLLRNIHSIEGDGALLLQGNVPEQSLIRLMIGTKESCLQATQAAVEETKQSLYQAANIFLVFNSISRYILLGRDAYKELEIIKAGLPRGMPIIGLYTYGEQAPLRAINYQGRSYLHNQTITVVGLGA